MCNKCKEGEEEYHAFSKKENWLIVGVLVAAIAFCFIGLIK